MIVNATAVPKKCPQMGVGTADSLPLPDGLFAPSDIGRDDLFNRRSS
jgi:hypothetical protein